MLQTKFKERAGELPESKKSEFYEVIKNIYGTLYQEVNNRILFEQLIKGKVLERTDTALRKAPEDLTEELIIRPLLKFLGHDQYHRRTSSLSAMERREADYTLIVGNERVLVEAEPLNKDLNIKGSGVEQVESWLEKRSFEADYGIATNGFTWILIIYNPEEYKLIKLLIVELREFFQELLGQHHITNHEEILNNFYNGFSQKYILPTAKNRAIVLEENKESITNRFYEDYIKYVFGFNKKDGKHTYCLFDAISPATGSLMSRLIFVKFLEDKGLVEQDLLRKLCKEYDKSKLPITFYKAYLQPLFYDVFNTPEDRRKSNVIGIPFFKKIPYLNGGLFRELVPKEREYDVENELIELIIKNLLEKYSFTLNGDEESLNPDILGNVFEKTINYLTGENLNDKRKELGAYYTPEEVTSFISKNTIHPFIFEKVKIILKNFGWDDANINSYESLADFLDNAPSKSNPKIIKAIYDKINEIKILDPACGSGHFLTSAMKELIFIKKKLLEHLESDISYYAIKKQIISNNLHGVDIETSAVEIAKLRLWLSLIENIEVSDISPIETLPNIEYNIIDGDSLVGWANEGINQNVAITPYDDKMREIFEDLRLDYARIDYKFKLLSESEELLSKQGGRLVDNLKRAYSNLQILYSQEEGQKAVRLREILVTIRNSIYAVISSSFQNYIVEKSKKKNKKEILEKYKVSNQFHWNIDFGNIISSGGFDIITENPPYGIDIKENQRLYIPQILPYTNEYVTSALAFIERSYYLTKEGGYIGLIVPKSLAYSQRWSIGRKLIKDDLDTIVDVSRAFKDVKLEQVIVIIKKGAASKKYKVKDIADTNSYVIDKSYIDLTDTILVHANGSDLSIFKKLSTGDKFLGNVSKTSRGLPFQSQIAKTKTKHPIYRGEDISRYNLNDTIEYLPSELIDDDNEKIKFLMQPKILSQRIVAHVKKPVPHIIIMSTLDKKGVLSLDTVENTVLTDNDYSLEFITCLLNSKLASWYAYRYIFAKAIRTMDLDGYYIGKIPLPKKSKNLGKFKTLYDELEKAQKGQDIFQVSKIDLKINNLIYEVYDLNELETNLIESDFIKEKSINYSL